MPEEKLDNAIHIHLDNATSMKTLRTLASRTRRMMRDSRTKVLRRFGCLQSNDWAAALPDELQFWETALRDHGRHWKPELYQARMDPNLELQEDLKALIDAPPGAVVRILDVGAGPLTTLGKRWSGRTLEIIAVDPLAEQYAQLMARLGIRPPVTTQPGQGEKLLAQFPRDSFDLAYASNALDHSYDPLAAIDQMLALVKPRAHVYLWHFANEALTETYRGLHQWNFARAGQDLVINDGHKSVSVRAHFAGRATLTTRDAAASAKQAVVAVLKKNPPG